MANGGGGIFLEYQVKCYDFEPLTASDVENENDHIELPNSYHISKIRIHMSTITLTSI